MKKLLLISLVSIAVFAGDNNENAVAASSSSTSSSSSSIHERLVCSIGNLRQQKMIPRSMQGKKTLFLSLLDAIKLQDDIVNLHHQHLLFENKKNSMQKDIKKTLNDALPKGNKGFANHLQFESEEMQKFWNAYEPIISTAHIDEDNATTLKQIIKKYAQHSNVEIQKILSYLQKVVKLKELNAHRQRYVMDKINNNLMQFAELIVSPKVQYLDLNTFQYAKSIYTAMIQCIKAYKDKQQNIIHSQSPQDEDLVLYWYIMLNYNAYQDNLNNLNHFKNELINAVKNIIYAENLAKKDQQQRLGKKYQKRTFDKRLFYAQ